MSDVEFITLYSSFSVSLSDEEKCHNPEFQQQFNDNMKKILLDDICKQISGELDELPISVSGKRNIQTGEYEVTMELNLIDKYKYKTLKMYEDVYLEISKIVHK